MSKADDVFIRQFVIVLVLLAAYGVGAGILGVRIAGSARDAAAGSERATLERIAPVGRLKLGEPGQRTRAKASASASVPSSLGDRTVTPAPDSPDSTAGSIDPAAASGGSASGAGAPPAAGAVDEFGEAIYKQYCFACHLTGVAEAPKTGSTEAWAPRAATGFDALYKSVVNGKGTMPPRAGFAHLSDEEIEAGIRYLLAAANVTAE